MTPDEIVRKAVESANAVERRLGVAAGILQAARRAAELEREACAEFIGGLHRLPAAPGDAVAFIAAAIRARSEGAE